MPHDVYVNLDPLSGTPRAHQSLHEVQHALVFVEATGRELRTGNWVDQFQDLRRRLPRPLLTGGDVLVFRGVPLAAVRTIREALALPATVCVALSHQVGAAPKLELGESLPASLDAATLLRRARAVEFEALLAWSRAVWSPKSYHFLLPSGAHAGAFVKAGQAISSPRDADALANWLLPCLGPRTGIVADTGTLTPLLLAATARREGVDAVVRIVEGYPQTYLDVSTALEAVATNADRVLAILSVNSTGQLLSHLIQHLQQLTGRQIEVQVVIMIDQWENRDWKQHGAVPVERWLPLPDRDPPANTRVYRGDCELCADPTGKRTTVVPIDPVSFDRQLPSFLRRVMPAVDDARANHEFWELCSKAEAIAVAEEPEIHAQERRREGRMGIKVRHARLLELRPGFAQAVRKRLEVRLEEIIKRGDEKDAKEADKVAARYWASARPVELVLVPKEDCDHAQFSGFVRDAFKGFGARATPVPGEARQWSEELKQSIRAAKHVTVFTLGTVTGTTLQAILVGVQSTRRGHSDFDFELDAVVVHARPNDLRLWETLVNSYSGRLVHLWLTYLPDRSPLQDEGDALDQMSTPDLAAIPLALEFFNARNTFCGGAAPTTAPLFWGTQSNGSLSPHSIFGEGLSALATYAAVSSAITMRRLRDTSPPERLVFEIGSMIRSYYDPLILASMFRWLRPSECWWGPQSPTSIASEMLERARRSNDPAAFPMLVSELLLAAALGKVPDAEARATVLAAAETLQDDPIAGGAVQLGRAMVEHLTAKGLPGRVAAAGAD